MAVTKSHIITRTYTNLKGFSTDSMFLRTPNISQSMENMHRDPDGTFGPRRGYQCETADIGGLGLTSFDNPCRCGIEMICVHRDGNLYRKVVQTISINYTATAASEWFNFSIFTNSNAFDNAPGWSYEPWSVSPWSVPNGESITFNGFLKASAIVNGNQTNVNTFVVQSGHSVQVGDVFVIMTAASQTQTRTVTAIGATSITFSGLPLSAKNNDRLDVFIEQLFFKGYDVNSIYTVGQFIDLLNSIQGVTAYTTGDTSYPAAFIPIQEPTNMTTGTSTEIVYAYWEKIAAPLDPILPGSANPLNQNALDFEIANFCIFDEVLYCTNGYDYPIKYDGQNVYLAGMRSGDRPFVEDSSAGPLIENYYYYYAISYEQIDNAGHIVEGPISPLYQYQVPSGSGNRSANVTIINILDDSGYNTSSAVATGAADQIYGPDNNNFYYHYTTVDPGQTFIPKDTAFYIDRAIATVNWGVATPFTGTNFPIDPGHGLIIGDIINFEDNAGVLHRRTVVDIDTTTTPNQIEINGSPVDTSNNPNLSAEVDNILYGHVGIVDGDQTNVTVINMLQTGLVNHTLAIGDIIEFVNAENEFTTRTVTAVSSSTITVNYAVSVLDRIFISTKSIDDDLITIQTNKANAIDLDNNDAISNNLRINVYRSLGSTDGSLVELSSIARIPNDPSNDSFVYLDELPDTELPFQAAFVPPIQSPDTPPKCKYILTYQNMIIYAGGSRYPEDTQWSLDAFYFSQGDQPEAVPAATNFQLLPSNDDVISGVGVSGSTLVVGKDRSIYAISGDLLTSQFQVVPVAPGSNIGFSAHATIRAVGNLLYFLYENGVYSMAESNIYPTDADGDPVPRSKPIDVLFRTKLPLRNQQYVYKRATAFNYNTDNEYWLFLPCEDVGGTARNANTNSIVLCMDYMERNWFLWRNINAAGGFTTIENTIYWQERRLSNYVGNTSNTYRQHRDFRITDYADHTQPINVDWRSSWEDLAYPEVRKKFIRAMLLLDRIVDFQQVNQPYMEFASYLDRFSNLKHTVSEVTTVNNSVRWGEAWSWKPWSGVVDSFISIPLRQGTTAKSMQIGLHMRMINTTFKFQGFQLEISPEYAKTFVR